MDQDAPAKPREQKVTWLSPRGLGLALNVGSRLQEQK